MEKIIVKEKDLEGVAGDVLDYLLKKNYENATILALQGDLGAGKTTFTKEMAKLLGVKESITSPTFVIQKYFDLNNEKIKFKKLIHIDTYRINSPNEISSLGWAENLSESSNLIIVEWPENIKELLPQKYITLRFLHSDEKSRSIELIDHN